MLLQSQPNTLFVPLAGQITNPRAACVSLCNSVGARQELVGSFLFLFIQNCQAKTSSVEDPELGTRFQGHS